MPKKKGIIVCGYPCIGKSSVAEKSQLCIDLESSCFTKSYPYWYIDYCDTAISLAKQGRIVFVSTHSDVIDFLEQNYKEDIYVCVFVPQLKWWDLWISRAKIRFDKDQTRKNSAALERIRTHFRDDIEKILTCGLPIIMPATLSYNLADYIELIYKEVCQ